MARDKDAVEPEMLTPCLLMLNFEKVVELKSQLGTYVAEEFP